MITAQSEMTTLGVVKNGVNEVGEEDFEGIEGGG